MRPLYMASSAAIRVRKHRAPKCALRRGRHLLEVFPGELVRKHRAPKGALRPQETVHAPTSAPSGQKAPSAKRCIKTVTQMSVFLGVAWSGQKAPSAKRCIKTV